MAVAKTTTRTRKPKADAAPVEEVQDTIPDEATPDTDAEPDVFDGPVDYRYITDPTPGDWEGIRQQLEEPFDPELVDFRVLRSFKVNGKWVYDVAAYVDKVTVMQRINDVVGHNWHYDFTPIVLDLVKTPVTEKDEGGQKVKLMVDVREMTRAKGVLRIFDVTRSALGDSSNASPSKGCDSDTFKRTAVMFGVGQYLYQLPQLLLNETGVDYGRILPGALKFLRDQMPKPSYSTGINRMPIVQEGDAGGGGNEPEESLDEPEEETQEETPEQYEERRATSWVNLRNAMQNANWPFEKQYAAARKAAIADFLKVSVADMPKLPDLPPETMDVITAGITSRNLNPNFS